MEILQVNRKKTIRYAEKAKYKGETVIIWGETVGIWGETVRMWGETVICIK